MTVRERTSEIERMTLSPYACLSENSSGRARPEEPCPMRTCFQRDRDRIIHCKSFRRLKQKTQVFLAPEMCIRDRSHGPYLPAYPVQC